MLKKTYLKDFNKYKNFIPNQKLEIINRFANKNLKKKKIIKNIYCIYPIFNNNINLNSYKITGFHLCSYQNQVYFSDYIIFFLTIE